MLVAPRRSRPVTVELLFAYGTLMRGYPLHPVLGRGATYLGSGEIRGRLLDLGAYPGLVEGRGTVTGEVYRIEATQLLPAVDREEGYNFERRRRKVTLTDGDRTWAWVYHYQGPREGAVPIVHGDYRRACPPRESSVSRHRERQR